MGGHFQWILEKGFEIFNARELESGIAVIPFVEVVDSLGWPAWIVTVRHITWASAWGRGDYKQQATSEARECARGLAQKEMPLKRDSSHQSQQQSQKNNKRKTNPGNRATHNKLRARFKHDQIK